MRSGLTRLTVMLATQPLANRRRALAMSSDLLNTGMPTASTLIDGRFHERQHHVQIVDHQVQHHADVRAARRVRREAVRLDEARVSGHAFEILENGIEPLDVTDLQDALALLRQFHQFGGLRGVVGHRLLHQHVLALLQQRFGQARSVWWWG